MWNRVFLLVSGIASGWTLVGLLTVPRDQLKTQAWRLSVSLAVGIFVIVLLFVSSPQAALTASITLLFCIFIAYAAKARQVNKEGELTLPRMNDRPLIISTDIGVLLVSEDEPTEYKGLVPWALRFRRREARGQAVPHWLMRPLAFARIRTAYRAMGSRNPLHGWLIHLVESLAARLGEGFVVRGASLSSEPTVAALLVRLAEKGLTRVCLVSLGLSQDALEPMYEQVSLSGARECGVQVLYIPGLEGEKWPLGSPEERLQALSQGKAVAVSQDAVPAVLDDLQDRITAALA
ncbi:MAG: hypothetical protein A2Y73_02335 [Chloroflexi bacterium RBG_13_56_8]|nr:MAG: hypothetical protein A2Y73_02335 [Chloroflexi bacterium RBG_13_56_8]